MNIEILYQIIQMVDPSVKISNVCVSLVAYAFVSNAYECILWLHSRKLISVTLPCLFTYFNGMSDTNTFLEPLFFCAYLGHQSLGSYVVESLGRLFPQYFGRLLASKRNPLFWCIHMNQSFAKERFEPPRLFRLILGTLYKNPAEVPWSSILEDPNTGRSVMEDVLSLKPRRSIQLQMELVRCLMLCPVDFDSLWKKGSPAEYAIKAKCDAQLVLALLGYALGPGRAPFPLPKRTFERCRTGSFVSSTCSLEEDDVMEVPYSSIFHKDARGRNLLHIGAEHDTDGNAVESLLLIAEPLAFHTDYNGMTPLHVASLCGNLFYLRPLLELPGLAVRGDFPHGKTALHYAVKHGHSEACALLAPAVGPKRDKHGLTAIHELPFEALIATEVGRSRLSNLAEILFRNGCRLTSDAIFGKQASPLVHLMQKAAEGDPKYRVLFLALLRVENSNCHIVAPPSGLLDSHPHAPRYETLDRHSNKW